MNTFKKLIGAVCLATGFVALPAEAQNTLPEGSHPMIVVPHQQNVNYRERMLCVDVLANIDYEVTSDQDWAKIRKGSNGVVYVQVDVNYDSEPRTANITFENTQKAVKQTFVLTQGADASVESVPQDVYIKPSSAQANSQNSDGAISKSYDGKTSTIYHSQWSPSQFVVSESNPAVLTYNFKDVECINYLNYVPRQDGNVNGRFGKLEILYKLQGETKYTSYGTYDWGESAATSTVMFGEEGLKNPQSIQFKVYSGGGNFASCAEMQFYANSTDPALKEFSIFADDLYTTLRADVTEDDIARLTNPFVKSLAKKIYEGKYSTAYRVAEFPCLLAVETLSDLWNAPGKYYDQLAGVTGISFAPGTHAVIVSGLPKGKNATLKVVAWYNGKVGGNFDGGDPQTTTYSLSNGLNTIVYDPVGNGLTFVAPYISDYDGLAYIDYHDAENPDAMPNMKVHFVNGVVNGYLSPDKTNEEMHELTANAKNKHMDVLGKKAHSVWTSKGLHDYCKSTSGSIGYRQYINTIDSLVQWEHDLLGLTKYNRLPKNRTFAYVNYTYYMFQGGLGVSFHQDQERRVLNCNTLINNDDDAIWGLSHEWGHQHQMHPYFCWAGQSEVSNNMFSYYNIMHMGYRRSDKINNWAPARRHMLNDETYSSGKEVSDARISMYNLAGSYGYSADLKALCLEMKDGIISAYADNPLKAVSQLEIGDGEKLCPFIMLYTYFTRDAEYADFGPDLYESLRQTDDENGSTVEKKNGVDKYELIASAQNYNKNGKLEVLKATYPNSCWVKNNYITASNCAWQLNSAPAVLNFIRKTSRLTGYNLVPYFEKWGFIRTIAAKMGDYGDKRYLLTKAMYDEFIADMDALVADGTLKVMPEGMVEEISNAQDFFMDKPVIPN